jgi:phenylacetic acid degradation protein/carnitine operon protein CaiE
MLRWKTEGTKLYQLLPEDCRQSLRPCKPLAKQGMKKKKEMDRSYTSWKQKK